MTNFITDIFSYTLFFFLLRIILNETIVKGSSAG